jgi:hypothetical protein
MTFITLPFHPQIRSSSKTASLSLLFRLLNASPPARRFPRDATLGRPSVVAMPDSIGFRNRDDLDADEKDLNGMTARIFQEDRSFIAEEPTA